MIPPDFIFGNSTNIQYIVIEEKVDTEFFQRILVNVEDFLLTKLLGL